MITRPKKEGGLKFFLKKYEMNIAMLTTKLVDSEKPQILYGLEY